MKKNDYLVLLVGIILIMVFFMKYEYLEFLLIFFICVIFFISIITLTFFIMKEKRLLRKGEVGIPYIFTCCFINNDVDFSKFSKIISKGGKIKTTINVFEFVEELVSSKDIIKVSKNVPIKDLIDGVNSLLDRKLISVSDVVKFDSKFISNCRKKSLSVITNDLNLICKRLREDGLELIQIYPFTEKRDSKEYYLGVIPISGLIDLNQIVFLR